MVRVDVRGRGTDGPVEPPGGVVSRGAVLGVLLVVVGVHTGSGWMGGIAGWGSIGVNGSSGGRGGTVGQGPGSGNGGIGGGGTGSGAGSGTVRLPARRPLLRHHHLDYRQTHQLGRPLEPDMSPIAQPLIVTKSILQSHTKVVGLDQLLSRGARLVRASEPFDWGSRSEVQILSARPEGPGQGPYWYAWPKS